MGTKRHLSFIQWVILPTLLPWSLSGSAATGNGFRAMIEADWLRQANSLKGSVISPSEDASGGCDGIKNGKAGFHTQKESNPWWQVDLGSVREIGRIAVWNRTEGSTFLRTRHLVVFLSDNGKSWREVYRHKGTPFFGFPNHRPLSIVLSGQAGRFIRVGLTDVNYLHLDEVEVFAPGNNEVNLALNRPATQSSSSPWSTPDVRSSKTPFYNAARAALSLAEAARTLEQRAESLSRYDRELERVRKEFATPSPSKDYRALYLKIRGLRRDFVLSLPALSFDRLLINKRPRSNSRPHMCEQYLGRHSAQGPGLVILDNWKKDPQERELTRNRLPPGSILHPDLSYDAKRVVFSFCDHTESVPAGIKILPHPINRFCGYNNQKNGARRYLLFEATLDGKEIRQLTGGPSDPMKTAGDRATVLIEDLDPCYLPNGDLLFTSTRAQNFGRCHSGVYKPSFQLYRAKPDGSEIEQISFGELNEWDPSILSDGRIIYTRWDYINRHNTWFQSLWTTYPDGTATAHYYGNYTKNPCVTCATRAIPGSRKVIAIASAHHFVSAGSVILIDPLQGQEGERPLTRLTPEVPFPETEGWNFTGAYATPYPLSEQLFLASYTAERVYWDRRLWSGSRFSKNAFGIYLVDTTGGRELIYRDPTTSCFTPLPIQPRPTPPILPSLLPPKSQGLNTGVCYVKDIYECTQPLEKGSIKYLRLNQIHVQPSAGFTSRGLPREEPVKGVIGTVPVNEDGSVSFTAPADMPFQLQALDKDKMAVMTMRSVIYLRPGERIGCIGCHESRSSVIGNSPHARMKVMDPVPLPGPRYPGGLSFMRTVQPVLDRHCISCHGLNGKAPKGIDLLSDKAFASLTRSKERVKIVMSNRETAFSTPKDYFAHAGTLMSMLLKGHQGIKLPAESRERIIAWLDLNAPKYGDYSFNRIEDRKPAPEGERELRNAIRERFGEKMANQPYAALVNVGQPDESRILMAPLSTAAGGWGEISLGGWSSKQDPSYQAMVKRVKASIAPMSSHDIAGTCGREPCLCRSCWVRQLRASRKKASASIGK